jgi:hypothetical protein
VRPLLFTYRAEVRVGGNRHMELCLAGRKCARLWQTYAIKSVRPLRARRIASYTLLSALRRPIAQNRIVRQRQRQEFS